MVDPSILCRKHLLGEHAECHMIEGTLRKGKSIEGFLRKKLVDPSSLYRRHNELVQEIERRGYNHKSPLETEGLDLESSPIDKMISYYNLGLRCEHCREAIRKKLPTGWTNSISAGPRLY